MKLRSYGKYFQHNMRLFTTIFIIICVAVISFYLYNSIHYQLTMIERDYQNDAERISLELDNKLTRISNVMQDIATLTWVKKLTTSSDVFLQEFTVLKRLECQEALSQYLSIDSSVMDIAIYIQDRELVVSQKGWFSKSEYRSYLMTNRCDIEPDLIYEAAEHRNTIESFLTADYNISSKKNIVMIKNLVDVSSPTASLILILNKELFNQSIAKLGSENIGLEVLNLSEEPLFYTSQEIPRDYEIRVASKVLPAYYEITYLDPSSRYNQYGFFNFTFLAILFSMFLLAVFVSFLLSLYNTRPLQQLMTKISGLVGDAPYPPSEKTEFELIENHFASLYAQKQDLQARITENYSLTRKYALMLILFGDTNFAEWMQYFDMLDILFTEDQKYSVWILSQKQDAPVEINFSAMLSELHPQLVCTEEIEISAAQTILLIGLDAADPLQDYDQTAEWMRSLALQRYNALLEIQMGTICGPGIMGISQSYHSLTKGAEQAEADPPYREVGKEIVQYIDEHFCDPDMSLKDLSARWHLSVPTISRLCKETIGVNFLDYLTTLRLEKAKKLLREASHTTAEIAQMVGYASEYSFRRAFQRNENCRVQDWHGENRDA